MAHLASFASTESGFFMICLRFLDAVDSCDIRLEASLDTFRILLDTFTICGRRVCASGWSKLPSAPASEQFALIFDFSFGKIGQMQLLPSNCFLHYKCTYINIYIYPSSPRSILFIDIRYTMVYVYTFAHVPVSCPVTPHHLYLPVETC